MCFYELFRFECGDWKWGNFRQHCNKEYRIGETCGMKLVLQTFEQPNKCRLCEKYHTKLRKREAECQRVKRWEAESKNPASIEKAYQNIGSLDAEIQSLYGEITRTRESRSSNGYYFSEAQYDHMGDTLGSKNASQVLGRGPAASSPFQPSQTDLQTAAQDAHRAPSTTSIDDLADGIEILSVGDDQGDFSPRMRKKAAGTTWHEKQESASDNLEGLSPEPLRARKVVRPSTRDGLHIVLNNQKDREPILTCADSGSCVNAMSFKLASDLGIKFKNHDPSSARTMSLPNGSLINSCGSFQDECSILNRAGEIFATILTEILIFKKLVNPPMLIGDAVLDEAGVWDRANEVLQSAGRIPETPTIRSLGNSSKMIRCCFSGRRILAFPDSGSELDCVSKSYASQHCSMMQKTSFVAFANGSKATSTHIVKGQLSLGWDIPIYEEGSEDAANVESSSPADLVAEDQDMVADHDEEPLLPITRDVIDVNFHTIQNLRYNFIIGGRSLEALQAYQHHREDFVDTEEPQDEAICRIFSSKKKRKLKDSEAQTDASSGQAISRANQDQVENARREEVDEQIRRLDGDARANAQRAEDERRRQYDDARND